MIILFYIYMNYILCKVYSIDIFVHNLKYFSPT